MRVDVQMLVDEIKTILFAIVAKDVVLAVSVSKLHDLTTNEVADAASNVDESEAVAGHPET